MPKFLSPEEESFAKIGLSCAPNCGSKSYSRGQYGYFQVKFSSCYITSEAAWLFASRPFVNNLQFAGS